MGDQKKRRSTDASRRAGKELLANRVKTVKDTEAVYMILNVYGGETPGERTLSKRSRCHVDNTRTHTHRQRSGRTWGQCCQAVVTFDPLAPALEMMPARQLNAGSRANTVFQCAYMRAHGSLCALGGVNTHSQTRCQTVRANGGGA